ncbi:hydroxysteroid 11-beta-dehydrogenase 1-like protein isoform X3 [Enhydra lutris kenyoni]|nr:hydroxysteroid 11-beta-dehydrogenase 1-like protein isoform X3 [Enhydra lutris kenyoni]
MKVLLLTGLGALFFSYYWDDNFDPASLQGARVLLTGASAGVGEELAYHYARLGSHLVLTAHTEALLQKVVGNCRKLGAPKVFFIAADMASPEVPERVVQFALDKLGGLDYLVLNHLGATPAGTRPRSVQATRWLLQASPTAARPRPSRAGVCPRCGDSESPPPPGELPELRAADFVGAAQPDGQQRLSGGRVLAARCGPVVRGVGRPQVSRRASLERAGRLPGGGGAQGCSPALLGPVPTSFSSPYSAAKFALDGFFGSLRRELDVQDVNVAITMCVLGLRDRASTAEGFRGVSRAKAAPGPKAALAVIRGGATRAPGVFYPWRFHLLCLLRGWLPHPRAWFIRQELNVSAAAAA